LRRQKIRCGAKNFDNSAVFTAGRIPGESLARAPRQRSCSLGSLPTYQGKRICSRVSCSLTAEAGRISRGALAPQRSAPALFSISISISFSLPFQLMHQNKSSGHSSSEIARFRSNGLQFIQPFPQLYKLVREILPLTAHTVTSAPPVLTGRRFPQRNWERMESARQRTQFVLVKIRMGQIE
jgi:hypothetical protein